MASRARSIRRLSSSIARLIRESACSRGETADGRLGGGSFVPRLLAAADQDASLVPLAGEQDGVARFGLSNGMGDPLSPILDARVLLALRPSDLLGPSGDLA